MTINTYFHYFRKSNTFKQTLENKGFTLDLLNSLNPFTKIFLSLLCVKVLVQNYLDLRQRKSLKKHMNVVPAAFSDIISEQEHLKATKYNLEKLSFSKIVRSYRLIILLLWTLGGGLEFLSYSTLSRSNDYMSVMKFLLFFFAIEMVLSLPVSIYSTFVIEQKYGFNKTTKKTFITDLFKSILISSVLMIPLFLGLLKLLSVMGQNWWIYSWAAFVGFQFTLIFLYPKFIAPLFNKFSLLPEGELATSINELLKKINFNAKEIFTMDASKRSSHGNAYFTGFGKSKRIVFFDTLLEQMNNKEILAILAHELGHFKKKHIIKSMIISIFTMLILFYLLSIAISSNQFLAGHGLNSNVPAAAIILFTIIAPIYSFLLSPLGNIFSRKNEFEADDFACKLTSGKDLKSALIKLYKFNYGALAPDEAYSNFYDSHPPAIIRIKNIEKNILNQ